MLRRTKNARTLKNTRTPKTGRKNAQKNARFTYRLFDLAKDPQEKTDLSGQQPKRTERMKNALHNWQRSVIGSLNGRDYPRR